MALIGVFDSGVGGLSVLHALRFEAPDQDYIYFGDSAFFPYGKLSAATIIERTSRCAQYLKGQGVESLVLACNTASALAIGHAQVIMKSAPVFGVLNAGARYVYGSSRNGKAIVFATEATRRSGAYPLAIKRAGFTGEITVLACPDLVEMAEHARSNAEEIDAVLKKYADTVRSFGADTLLLGCTHFSVYAERLQRILGKHFYVCDPAAGVAADVVSALGLADSDVEGRVEYHITGSANRFARAARPFLGVAPDQEQITQRVL